MFVKGKVKLKLSYFELMLNNCFDQFRWYTIHSWVDNNNDINIVIYSVTFHFDYDISWQSLKWLHMFS